MRGFSVFTMKTKTRTWRHISHYIEIPIPKNHDIEIPRPKNRDTEIRGLKHHDIEKQRQLSQDIVIPRHFFRGRKTTTSRFQDQKATTSSFCGILALMPPDSKDCIPNFVFIPHFALIISHSIECVTITKCNAELLKTLFRILLN